MKYYNALSAGLITAVAFMAPLAAMAADSPSADEITAAVSDHTYQGSMAGPDSGFAEYYAPDGAIRGDGYSGKWRVEDGLMCFQYGDKPENCWDVTLDGPSMVMLKDGKVDGNGMLVPGNAGGF
ncbi:MAG: hypothetical protein WBB85_19010 [Albidovulum sp.]|uniref:hypothetical protein n=1 Tax=Albidovulum sp. TaxID=1872424 RepID=UPI003CA381D1